MTLKFNMNQETLKSLEELNPVIHESLGEVEDLIAKKDSLAAQRLNIIQDIENEKRSLVEDHVNQGNLSDRNEEVRRKFSVVDVIVKGSFCFKKFKLFLCVLFAFRRC